MKTQRHGFTLVELLVVMAIIGVLAGLMFPALGAIRKRAYATQSHEMVSQVQDAWQIHLNDFRSFPDPTEFEDSKKRGDDVYFPMNPYNLGLLNWRCDKPTDCKDKKTWVAAFKQALTAEIAKKSDNKPRSLVVNASNRMGKKEDFTISTRDAYFEIDQLQWICGVLNVWGVRKAQSLYKKGGRSSAETVVEVLQAEKFPDPRVYAQLDTGYDGKMDVPVATTTTSASQINRSTAAWVFGASYKDDYIISW